MSENIKIGRWTITNQGIETLKENNAPELYGISDIWSVEKRNNYFLFELPVYVCSRGWVSNVDLLDFNSAFLVSLERFEDSKPINFIRASWAQTLRRQYKRINTSFDINSHEGRKHYEYQKEYRASLSTEDLVELMRIRVDEDLSKNIEVFGDGNSRNN